MQNINRDAWIKQYLKKNLVTRRFTARQWIRKIMVELGYGERRQYGSVVKGNGDGFFVMETPLYKTIHNEVNRALKRKENGSRVYYHSAVMPQPVWFHRDHCTIAEALKFYIYLRKLAGDAAKEAQEVKDYIDKRRRTYLRRVK